MIIKNFLRDDPILLLILIWHGLFVSLLVFLPQYWLVVILLVFISHLLVMLACLLPASPWPGRGIRKITAAGQSTIYLTFDDGPDPEITPQVIAMLNKYNAQASFFALGEKVIKHPDIICNMAKSGHMVENHSWSHPAFFFFLPWSQLRKQLTKTNEVISTATGRVPNYFRAPAGIKSPMLQLLLIHLGLQLAAWSKRGFDTMSKDADKIEQRLLKDLQAGDILLLHDGSSAVDNNDQQVVLTVLFRILEHCRKQGYKVSHLPDIKA